MYGNTDFYGIKGIVEHTLDTLGITTAEFEPLTTLPWMHPGRTAQIDVDGKAVGYVGELHPTVAKNYGIGARTYIAVLDEAELINAAKLVSTYKALPKFPAMIRDISMLVKDHVYAVSYTHRDVYKRQEETATAIRTMYTNEDYVLDTHTAVAYAAYNKYIKESGDTTPTVIVSTASPYKFAKDVCLSLIHI